MQIVYRQLICFVIMSVSVCNAWDFDFETKFFNIVCVDGKPVPLFGEANSSIHYSVVEINDCPAPTTTYSSVLRMFKLNIPRKLKIGVNEGSVLDPSQFEGLTIEALHIACRGWNYNDNFDTNILSKLSNLKEFKLDNAPLRSLPLSTTIKQLELWNGKSVGAFGGCFQLEHLILVWWKVDQVEDEWLGQCSQLRTLTLKQLSPAAVKRILSGATAISELYIYKCQLLELPAELIMSLTNLRKLHVHHNRIKFIYLYKAFENLQDVDLSYNELSECDQMVRILEKHGNSLVNFTVARNKLLDVCQLGSQEMVMISNRNYILEDGGHLPKLKRLSFADTATTKLCFDVLSVESLEYFDLSNNKLTMLEFQHLPLHSAKRLKEINLRGTGIKDVTFTETHFEMLADHEVLTLSGLTLVLDCDCAYAWFARAVRDKRVSVDAFCGNVRLEHAPTETMECAKYICESCTCRRSWGDGKVTANCDGDQTRIPQVVNLSRLFAYGNQIDGFNATDLPESLVEIDLRSNHISKLDSDLIAALFSVKERQILLSGNPFVCDCQNVPLFEALKEHITQVADYDNITCNNDRPVSTLDLVALCAEPLDPRLGIALSLLLGVVVVLAVSTALFYRYERPIKVFLYARGCCPWWLNEDEVDADRPYDAFVSFAHQDDDFVMENLMPELEECGYRLCVHYRDWLPGEWIPAQITRSVLLSRRTIIVLSKSYLESCWGLLEFRLAHVSTLKEGRPRIIVLVLDDVFEEQMDDEMKGYLNSNTYVKWGEKWFWDKLKYAMPHRIIPRDESNGDHYNAHPMNISSQQH